MLHEVAAESLSSKQRKRTVSARKNKGPTVKTVLCTPYVAKWPHVESSTQQHILQLIKRCASDPEAESSDVQNNEHKQLLRRHGLVCGVQNVTRCLERDQLRLVIVDRSSPWQLHQHLTQLSAVRQCPAVAVDSMATTLCPVLVITRLSALGIKKCAEANVFDELVDYVSSSCAPIHLPWLDIAAGLAGSLQPTIDNDEDEDNTKKPAPDPSPTDYSHLYIYKKDSERTQPVRAVGRSKPASTASDYMSLTPSSSSSSSSLSDSEDSVSQFPAADDNNMETATMSGRGYVTSERLQSSYRRPNVGVQVANPDKKKQKNNLFKC